MSASDNGPDGRKERYRRAVTFLEGARHLPELTPSQIDRIERHLNRARPLSARRSRLMPALATLAVVLLAGAALAAVTGTSLSRLPGIGPLLGALFAPAPAGSPARGQARRPEQAAPRAPSVEPAPTRARAPLSPAAQATPAPAPSGVIAPGQEASQGAAQGASQEASQEAPQEAPIDAPAPPRKRRAQTAVALAVDPTARPRDPALIAAAPAAPASLPAAAGGAGPATGEGAAPVPTAPAATASTLQPAPPAITPQAAAPPAIAAERSIVAESRSFAAALGRWHRDHDAGAALAALDAYERRFPDGEIRLEAQLLRAEILLAGGHDSEGLTLLDPLALSGMPRARELRTVRGELRIKLGRCLDGKSDLGAVLAEGTADPLAQRARQALAHCP